MYEALPEHLRAFVDEQIHSGRYVTSSEMIVHGLELLREKEMLREAKLADLRREIQKGIDDIEAGRVKPVDREQMLEEIHQRLERGVGQHGSR